MKSKTLSTIVMSLFIVLVTSVFGYANYEAACSNFPFFHLGCLIVGGMIITSLKTKYDKLYLSECIGSFALYAIFVSLFTPATVNMVKSFMS